MTENNPEKVRLITIMLNDGTDTQPLAQETVDNPSPPSAEDLSRLRQAGQNLAQREMIEVMLEDPPGDRESMQSLPPNQEPPSTDFFQLSEGPAPEVEEAFNRIFSE